jgi:ribonuclease VapC
MVVDSSAIVAILLNEPERDAFVAAIARANRKRMSEVNLLEARIVADRTGSPAKAEALDRIVEALEIAIEPATGPYVTEARHAYRRYGKGNHEAKLNLGDCFAYVLSKATGEPLLFKDEGLALTDVERAP